MVTPTENIARGIVGERQGGLPNEQGGRNPSLQDGDGGVQELAGQWRDYQYRSFKH